MRATLSIAIQVWTGDIMSADRWSDCPKCKWKADKERVAIEKEARNSYGKVPVEVFENLKRKASGLCATSSTLREEWQIGITEGEFYIRYSASCGAPGCDFEYRYTLDAPLDLDNA
jgi:hypothetical protein